MAPLHSSLGARARHCLKKKKKKKRKGIKASQNRETDTMQEDEKGEAAWYDHREEIDLKLTREPQRVKVIYCRHYYSPSPTHFFKRQGLTVTYAGVQQ